MEQRNVNGAETEERDCALFDGIRGIFGPEPGLIVSCVELFCVEEACSESGWDLHVFVAWAQPFN
jgi:hypothetical protein